MSALPLIEPKSTIYYMRENRIHRGVVLARYEIDDINVKYLIKESIGNRWILDSRLYGSIDELVADLRNCVVV